MKKILLLIIAIVGVLQVSAQEADSLQNKSAALTIDSLTVKLNKLQHDYDYLYCDYELHKLMTDLTNLSNSVDISSNSLITYYYNSRFDRALYTSYVNNYDAKCAAFNTLKDKIEVVRVAVLVRGLSSNFTEMELSVIKASLAVIQQSTSTVEASLKHYDVAIQTYRSLK